MGSLRLSHTKAHAAYFVARLHCGGGFVVLGHNVLVRQSVVFVPGTFDALAFYRTGALCSGHNALLVSLFILYILSLGLLFLLCFIAYCLIRTIS
jgi:hypothetical protein